MPRQIINPYALSEDEKHRLVLNSALGDKKISQDEYDRILADQKKRMSSGQLDAALGMISPPSAPIRDPGAQEGTSYAQVIQGVGRVGPSFPTPQTPQPPEQQGGLFDPQSFTGPRVVRRTREDFAIETRMLLAESDDFERVRQQLTENYERMDSFAKSQFNDMNKLIGGIDNARNDGRLRPIEHLRAMSTIAARARQFNWKYHFKAPGGEVGDVVNKSGINYIRQPDGGLKYAGITPEYIKQNSVQLPNGQWWVPVGESTAKILDENPFAQNTFETMGPAERLELREKMEARISRQVGSIMKSAEEMGRPISPRQAARMAVDQIKAIDEQLDEILDSAAKKSADPVKKAMGKATSQDDDRALAEQESQAAGQMAAGVQEGIERDIAAFNSPEAHKQRYVSAAVKAGRTEEDADRLYEDSRMYFDDKYVAKKMFEPLPPIPKQEKDALRTKLSAAKTDTEKNKVRAENWQSDEVLRTMAKAPAVLRSEEDFKNLVDGRVYLIRRKDGAGYDRLWYTGGKFIQLQPKQKSGTSPEWGSFIQRTSQRLAES